MDQNGTNQNAGVAGDGSQGFSDTGSQGGNPAPNSGSPAGQGGQPTGSWEAEKQQMQKEIRALNQALVDSRRVGGNRNGQNQNGLDQDAFSTPEGQYAISLQIATGNLRSGLENVIGLYPELPAEDISRIRQNPWAFASMESFLTGNVEAAMLEIEQAMLDRVTALGQNGQGNQGNQNPGQGNSPAPATVNGNPAPEPETQNDATPGTDEDQNLWTMPMHKLEQVKNKAVAKMSQQS